MGDTSDVRRWWWEEVKLGVSLSRCVNEQLSVKSEKVYMKGQVLMRLKYKERAWILLGIE